GAGSGDPSHGQDPISAPGPRWRSSPCRGARGGVGRGALVQFAMRVRLPNRLAIRTLLPIVGGLLRSIRFEVRGASNYRDLHVAGRPCVFVLWHGRLLPLGFLHRGEGVVALISRAADGDYLAEVLGRWGFVPVRGSSSRGGGKALRELIGHARAGRSI